MATSKSLPARGTRARIGPTAFAMYVRWAEFHGFRSEYIQDDPKVKRPGIQTATVVIKRCNAYGWLKTEMACTAWSASHRWLHMPAAHVFRQRHRLSGGGRPHQY